MSHKRLQTQLFSRREERVTARAGRRTTLPLSGFVPFRLYRLAAEVSRHLSDIYRTRFALEVAEWRVLATVGEDRGCTAQYVAASTRMHKTRVSRAIASLRRRGLIERITSAHDKRALQLRLSRRGRRIYRQLVPLALARERALLASLSGAERRGLQQALTRLEAVLQLSEPPRRELLP
jgi:DNA-binding MarR family transcriptional regulator